MATLLSILHDPAGDVDVLPLIENEHLFDDIYIVATDSTRASIVDALNDVGNVKIMPQNGMAQARRDVCRFALDSGDEGPFFYCDLDRLVHWLGSPYSREVQRGINEFLGYNYMVIGRTMEAMASHPYLQQQTEKMMISIVDNVDVFAGCRIFDKGMAEIFCEQSKENQAAVDIEWPNLAYRNGGKVGYAEVNGLSFEGNHRSYQAELELRIGNLWSVIEYANRNRDI